MRILYVGNAQGFNNSNKYYLIPQKLINGFTRLGHTVYSFNDRDFSRASNIFGSQSLGRSAVNRKLLEINLDYRPDLVVLGHCTSIENSTINQMRLLNKGVRVIYRNVDPLHHEQNCADIQSRSQVVDAVFITTAGEALGKFSNPRSKIYYFPNPVDRCIDNVKSFAIHQHDFDLLFVGNAIRGDFDHRMVGLKNLSKELPDFRCYFGGRGLPNPPIFGATYIDFLERARFGLCLNKSENYLYASDRLSQYMGCGLLAFVPSAARFEDILGEGSFIPYNDNEDLIAQIKRLGMNDAEWRRIAQTGWERIHKAFATELVCQYMIDMAFEGTSSYVYAWPTEGY